MIRQRFPTRRHGPVLRFLIAPFFAAYRHPYATFASMFGAAMIGSTARAWGLL